MASCIASTWGPRFSGSLINTPSFAYLKIMSKAANENIEPMLMLMQVCLLSLKAPSSNLLKKKHEFATFRRFILIAFKPSYISQASFVNDRLLLSEEVEVELEG